MCSSMLFHMLDDCSELRKINSVDWERGVRILSQQCETCVLRPGNQLDLVPGAVKEMVQLALLRQTAIICHDTLDIEEQAVCRGFADKYDTMTLQFARRLRLVVEVEPPKLNQ